MNYYTSDLHFGHANAINFDNRPFHDRDEMDRVMIELWNNKVQSDDTVYILGDICYNSPNPPEWYLERLKARRGSWHIYGHIHGSKDETFRS